MKQNGTGTVTPGSPSATLAPGRQTITIASAAGENDGIPKAVSDNVMAKCVFPDGTPREFQTHSVENLFAQVVGRLRHYYGVTGDIKAIALPDEVTAGATIEVEI